MQIEQRGMIVFSKQAYQKETPLFWGASLDSECQQLLNLQLHITIISDGPHSWTRHSISKATS